MSFHSRFYCVTVDSERTAPTERPKGISVTHVVILRSSWRRLLVALSRSRPW